MLFVTESERAKFWSSVKIGKPNECWSRGNRLDYSNLFHRGKSVKAHRFSYELTKGAIPPKLIVRHSCDNPPCCNPNHLSLGTKSQNTREAISRGRFKIARHGVSPVTANNCTCVVCGKDFYVANCFLIRGRKFCSRSCRKNTLSLFWLKVDKNGPAGCWVWTGAKSDFGHGVASSKRLFGKQESAHRVSWRLAHGANSIPSHLVVCHKCNNPACVNPDHLELGTPKYNTDHIWKSGRGNPPIGERAFMHVIKSHEAKRVKELIVEGKTNQEIGPMFNVHPMTIHAIRTGRSWKHISI